MSLSPELLAHGSLFGLAAHVILSAEPGSSLFSWHPTCMIIAWVLLMEGILLFKKIAPDYRVNFHWALQAGGVVLVILGYLVIWNNKEQEKKDHFVSYHGLCGIVTLGLLALEAIGGNLANFSQELAKSLPLVKPKLLRQGHRLFGVVVLAFLSGTLCLALFSNWFRAVTPSSVLFALCLVSVLYPPIFHLKNVLTKSSAPGTSKNKVKAK